MYVYVCVCARTCVQLKKRLQRVLTEQLIESRPLLHTLKCTLSLSSNVISRIRSPPFSAYLSLACADTCRQKKRHIFFIGPTRRHHDKSTRAPSSRVEKENITQDPVSTQMTRGPSSAANLETLGIKTQRRQTLSREASSCQDPVPSRQGPPTQRWSR